MLFLEHSLKNFLQLVLAEQEELESLLGDSGHLRTLAFLYASKGISSKALSIWHILARNYSTGLWKDTSISVEHDLPDVSIDSISGQKAAAIEASKLLEESADEDLVLEHLGWVCLFLHNFFLT